MFWNTNEQKLKKLGYTAVVNGYKKRLKEGVINKKEYKEYVSNFLKKIEVNLNNINNVNVATRQSFIDDEVLVSLNLSKIQQPEYDTDFIKSKIAFDYKNKGIFYRNEIQLLFDIFLKSFSLSEGKIEIANTNKSEKEKIELITGNYTPANQVLLYNVFRELLL